MKKIIGIIATAVVLALPAASSAAPYLSIAYARHAIISIVNQQAQADGYEIRSHRFYGCQRQSAIRVTCGLALLVQTGEVFCGRTWALSREFDVWVRTTPFNAARC